MRFNIKEMKKQGIFLCVLAVVLALIVTIPTVMVNFTAEDPVEPPPAASDETNNGSTENNTANNNSVTTDGKTESNAQLAPTHTHNWVKGDVVAPSCIEGGYTINTCKCKQTKFTDETAALGHTFGEWEIVSEPTTEEEGSRTRTCSVCNEVETEVLEKIGSGVTPDDDELNGDGSGNTNPDGNNPDDTNPDGDGDNSNNGGGSQDNGEGTQPDNQLGE